MTRVYSREEVRHLPIQARRPPRNAASGEAKTRAQGVQGLEFADFRAYEPGDEVSRIDWNVTARLGSPWVRTYLEERGHPVLLMVDVSSSTLLGRGTGPAREVIDDVAARLASAAIWSGCETGLLLFADTVQQYVPAATGVAHLTRMIRMLRRSSGGDTGQTDIAGALDYVQKVRPRRSLVFLLSDFLCADFRAALQRCAGRHEIVSLGVETVNAAVHTCGLVNVRDPESGAVLQVDTSSADVRAAVGEAFRQQREQNAEAFRKARVDYLGLNAQSNYVSTMAAFLRQRVG